MKLLWDHQSGLQIHQNDILMNENDFNSLWPSDALLWPSDALWRHRSGWTLVQVMAWCQMAPSHYLNQCLLIINEQFQTNCYRYHSLKQCMKRPVAHSLNSTWFWIELPENYCEPLKFIMKYISIQFCERPGHGRQFHALLKSVWKLYTDASSRGQWVNHKI